MDKRGFTPLENINADKVRNGFLTGFTLIEMIVVLVVASAIVLAFTAMTTFMLRQVKISRERVNMWSQLEYTLSDMRVRSVSAISTTTPLVSGGNITITDAGNSFSFQGESNIYNVTPDETGDNADYTYDIFADDDANNPGALVLETTLLGVTTSEVLVDGRYSPVLRFEHYCDAFLNCDEPNFITVTLRLTSPYDGNVAERTDGIRFWFLDVVQ